MFEELRAIVAENLGVEESELTMETSFREDCLLYTSIRRW